MNETNTLMNSLSGGFSHILAQSIEYLPRIVAAALVLILGWLLARALKTLSIRFIDSMDQLWEKTIIRKSGLQLQPRETPTRFVGEMLFWFTILFTLAITAEILGLGIFVNWLNQIVAYLPLLISGLLIVLAGFIVSSLLRDLVTSSMQSAGFERSDISGRLVQVIILFTAIIIGADQIGIDITFISVIAAIFLGATLGGLAIAFGLGARHHVANLLACHQLRKQFKAGDRVRFGELSGVIIEISNTQLILETDDGKAYIPAAKMAEEHLIQLTQEN